MKSPQAFVTILDLLAHQPGFGGRSPPSLHRIGPRCRITSF
jgi:hypothetical protein